ncbi:MAG TPA: DUF2203 domain-containing protein [Planktothrix sp.]|jgi:hypothetical protein
MSSVKTFTLQEAREFVPRLRHLVEGANVELEYLSGGLEEANKRYADAESVLRTCKPEADDKQANKKMREARDEFQQAIEVLSAAQNEYLECLNVWVERITEIGVILRDIRTGLLDFPAREGAFEYFLCWKLDDEEISYWHPIHEGLRGRKPLSVLPEYAL